MSGRSLAMNMISSTAAGYSACWGTQTGTYGYVYCFPDYMFGTQTRAYQTWKTYSRWTFRKLKMVYTPACSTTTGGIFSVAYFADPCSLLVFSSNTFNQLQDNPACMTVQPWAYNELDFSELLDKDFLGYSDLDVPATDTSTRQQFQGAFNAVWSAPQVNATEVTVGVMNFEWEIDLFQPVGTINIALEGKSKTEMFPPTNQSLLVGPGVGQLPPLKVETEEELVLVRAEKKKPAGK